MNTRHLYIRAILAIFGAVALLCASADTLSSRAPEGPPPPAPHPGEIVLLEELSSWIQGEPEGTRFPLFQECDLASAIRARPQSFELFSGFQGDEGRRRLLETLPYGNEIWQVSSRYELDSFLVAAMVEAESGFDPGAVSPQGAQGLMQVMPATALGFGVRDATDPAQNLEVGARYLGSLLRRYSGDIALALAAYNAGPTNVARYGGVPPFPETTRYVDKVLRRYVQHHQTVWHASEVDASALSGALNFQEL